MTENEKTEEAPSELEQLKEEAKAFKTKYLELLADQENTRKRLHKEKEENSIWATRSVILDFLHPLDHLEGALKYTDKASEDVKHWAVGFQMILHQFKDALASHGVKSFESLGKPFDPHLHDAVEMIETKDYPPGVVIEENIRGYTIGGKILRAARVKVSKEKLLEQEGEKP